MKNIEDKLHELGNLINDVRNYTKDDLEYIAVKLEEGYDELIFLFVDNEE